MAKPLPPHLLHQWDHEKNQGIDPRTITRGSGRNVHWRCEKGHSWNAVVKNRANGSGCPYCAGKRVLTGFNDLATTHPDLATQWDHENNTDMDPTGITAGTPRKAFWTCDQGHSWEAYIHSRAKGHGCPYCAGTIPIPGVNDFATTHPELLKEWDHDRNKTPPESLTRSSGHLAHWRCEKGHSWTAKISNRVQGTGCPYCTGRKVLPGFNDIVTTHPRIAVLWDRNRNGDNTPEHYSHGSTHNAWWLCPSGHSWDNTITKTVTSKGSCPVCTNTRVLSGVNDLETLHPEVAARWDKERNGVSASQVLAGSARRGWWICERGHSYEAYVYAQTRPMTGCPRCSLEDQSSSMENDLHSWVESVYPGEIRRKVRGLIGRDEIDFLIPGKNIAIEFNGLYWHSEENGKDRDYHHSKWSRCRDKGIQLITVWEDDWRDRRETVTSMIAHKLGVSDTRRVYARKTTVVPVTFGESSVFLDQNHIQGSARGSVYLGLADDTGIIAVSVWRKHGTILYLDRYTTSVTVVGGMGKLLKAGSRWGRDHGCDQIVTFADHEVSDGGLYETLGFTPDKELAPDYSYVVNNTRTHKFNYRKKRFAQDPDLIHREGLTERELARLNGLRRVWDAGKTRYVLDIKTTAGPSQ